MKLTRISNDSNGNGRFVVNFLDLITEQDREAAPDFGPERIEYLFSKALGRAKKIGGKRYRGKDHGGGIVFQSYESNLVEDIIALLK
jgi:hypothetical protein